MRIEECIHDQDDYIEFLIEAAESAIASEICEDLRDLEVGDGVLPADLEFTILLRLGDFYSHPETVTYGNPTEVKTLASMRGLFRNYSR